MIHSLDFPLTHLLLPAFYISETYPSFFNGRRVTPGPARNVVTLPLRLTHQPVSRVLLTLDVFVPPTPDPSTHFPGLACA